MSGAFDFTGVLASLPAILFAFDSFLVVGNIAGDMKNPEKNVSLSILLSMIISGALYLFITIGQICIGCGSAYDVFAAICGNNESAQIACTIIVSIFILISILGVLNALTMAAMRSMQAAVDEDIIACSKKIKGIAHDKPLLSGTIVLIVMVAVY